MIVGQISESNKVERKMIFILVLCAVSLNAVRCIDTSSKLIQVISPRENHTFALNTTELENKLKDAVDLQDRLIVVVSMTGIANIGKSFLFNFYLNYLNSEVTNLFLF